MTSELQELTDWVQKSARILRPDRVKWCDGSPREFSDMLSLALQSGDFEELNETTHPGCVVHRTPPGDSKLIDDTSYICTPTKTEVGPTNRWLDVGDARRHAAARLDEAMRGKTMYVVPYLLGPEDSPYARPGVEITDSPYVVLNLHRMTKVGRAAVRSMATRDGFVRAIHASASASARDRFIMHFPDTREVTSYGSSYGCNAILSRRSHGLRLASDEGRRDGWLAENMAIIGVEAPGGKTTYLAVALPARCGKTTLSMLEPPAPFAQYKVKVVSDAIAWLHLGEDGRVWAINPEHGLCDVAVGKSETRDPGVIAMTSRDALFTNVAIDANGEPWWDGLTTDIPAQLRDWQGNPYASRGKAPASHPDARYTISIRQCPSFSWRADDPHGVPISAIVFGSRRRRLGPLVHQAYSWCHGVLMGAMMADDSAVDSQHRELSPRRDPMGMVAHCGYNLADYFRHWIGFSRRSTALPKVFHVNWFLGSSPDRDLWPGHRENFRLLKWIIDRCEGSGPATKSAIGYVPTGVGLDLRGLGLPAPVVTELLRIDASEWRRDLEDFRLFLAQFADRLPEDLRYERNRIANELAT